jgi:hypothetical protein
MNLSYTPIVLIVWRKNEYIEKNTQDDLYVIETDGDAEGGVPQAFRLRSPAR